MILTKVVFSLAFIFSRFQIYFWQVFAAYMKVSTQTIHIFTLMNRYICLVIVFVLSGSEMFAASPTQTPDDYTRELMRFSGNIHQFNSIYPQEKVYLEFDNTAYFQGEAIFFKAFVTHATTLKRAPSKVLYVDLLAPNGQVLMRKKLKVIAGQADGAFALWDVGTEQSREKYGVLEYPSGFYEIRAYTQNMLNFSHEAIFSRVIPVYTKPKREGDFNHSKVLSADENKLITDYRQEADKSDAKVNLSFYPEGGDLIAGLPCNVAFKATGPDGLALNGAVVFQDRPDTAYTVHDGMGLFSIVPNGSGTIHFISKDGNRTKFTLPKALNSGYSMTAQICSDSLLRVNISRTPDLTGEKTAISVTCRGDVVYFKVIENDNSSQLEIDCSDWPLGVCRMTLYNTEGRILSSRSLFHNNSEFKSPTISLTTDSLTNKPFDREIINLKLTDKDGLPIRDRFCLSVRDAVDYGTGYTDNLHTNLLLSSDLKGYIHDPAWYLSAHDAEHLEALNLLTLVQGWERYEWKYMTGQEQFTEKHRIEDSLTINGWVLSSGKREPVSDIDVFASVVPYDDKSLFGSFVYHTDSTGYFGYDMLDFYGKAKMKIHLRKQKKNGKTKYPKNIRIRLERGEKPEPRPIHEQEMDLSKVNPRKKAPDFSDDVLPPEIRAKMGIVLDDVDIEEMSSVPFIDYDTFTAWKSQEETESELDMGEYSPDIWDYLEGKGFSIIEHFNPNNSKIEYHMAFGKGAEYPIHFYIHHDMDLASENLFPVPDCPLVIDMVDVNSILIYDKPMYERDWKRLCPLEAEYHSKRLDVEWFIPNDSTLTKSYLIDVHYKEPWELMKFKDIRNLSVRQTTFDGYSSPVEFYGPQYPEGPIEGKVDPRRTLYWNANVTTDDEGRARVEFYNNSFTRKFTINGAGITASGTPYILNQDW